MLALAVLVAVLVPPPVRADVAPVLVVYGFTVVDNVPPAVGQRFADAIAGEAAGPGVIIARSEGNIMPANVRADAVARNADYYLTGTIAPVGHTYAVLVQLVRVGTGLLTWNTSVQAAGAGDVVGIGAQVRQVIVDQTGRGSFAKTPPSYAAPARAALPAVPPSPPAPSADVPPSTFAVMMLGGTALPSDRSVAVRTVLDGIRKHGASAVADALTGADLLAAGAQACMDTGAATIFGGTLDTLHSDAPDAVTARIALQAYDCRTQSVLQQPIAVQKTAAVSSDAIATAAGTAIAAYFTPATPSPSTHR